MSNVMTHKKVGPIDMRTALEKRSAIPISWKSAAGILGPERAKQMLKEVVRGRAEWDVRVRKLRRARSSRA